MYTRRALLAACIILLACHGPRQATVVPAPSQPEGAATAADSQPLPVDAAIDANPALPGFDETGSDREAIEIGQRSGVPVHITHFHQKTPSPTGGGGDRLIRLVEDAAERDQDVTFDSWPYILGSSRTIRVLPAWAHDGGPEKLKAVMHPGLDG